jgi:hypothetical protein
MKRKMSKVRIDEISAVDRPAHRPARAAILKREKTEKRLLVTTIEDGHAHSIGTRSYDETEQARGTTNYTDGHSHEWVQDEQGNLTILPANNHTHDVAMVVRKGEKIPEGEMLTTLLKADSVSETPAQAADQGEGRMADQNDPAKKAEELAKRLERSEKMASMNDAQKAHFTKLSKDAQEEFLALTPEARAQAVEEVTKADAIVYTSDDGTTFRKSDSPALVAMAKRADASERARVQAEKLAKRERLAKRAAELVNLPGEEDAKIALLEAVETLPADQQKAVGEILKAHNDRMKGAFQTVGKSGGDKAAADSREEKLEKLAKSIQKAEPKLSFEQAYVRALDTEEGQEIYGSEEEDN